MHVAAEVVQRTIPLDEMHQCQSGRRTRPLVHRKYRVVRKEDRRNAEHRQTQEKVRILLQYGLQSIQVVCRETPVEVAQGELIRIDSNETKRTALRLEHLLVDGWHIRSAIDSMGFERMRFAVLQKGIVVSSHIQPQIDIKPPVAFQKRRIPTHCNHSGFHTFPIHLNAGSLQSDGDKSPLRVGSCETELVMSPVFTTRSAFSEGRTSSRK